MSYHLLFNHPLILFRQHVMERKWIIVAAILVLCYERNVSCTESQSTVERLTDTSVTGPTTKEFPKGKIERMKN